MRCVLEGRAVSGTAVVRYNAMEDELFVMLDTTLSSFCWQRRGLQFEERLTLGQPAVVKLRTRVLQLDLLEACKKCSVILQGI